MVLVQVVHEDEGTVSAVQQSTSLRNLVETRNDNKQHFSLDEVGVMTVCCVLCHCVGFVLYCLLVELFFHWKHFVVCV